MDIRDLRNPHNTGHPMHMRDFDSSKTTGHCNSTIISHVAYLMWNGGIDGQWEAINCTELIARIWYHSLRYMGPDSNFQSCRFAVVRSAGRLYRSGETEMTASQLDTVGKAFDAVGIYYSSLMTYPSLINGEFSLNVFDIDDYLHANYHLIIERQDLVPRTIAFDENVNRVNIPLTLEDGFYVLTITNLNDPTQQHLKAIRVRNDNPNAINTLNIFTNFTSFEADEPVMESLVLNPEDIRIALITWWSRAILLDGSINEAKWQGINRFLISHNLSGDHAEFFGPRYDDAESRINAIADAVMDHGANVVVLPWFQFIEHSIIIQEMFPDVKFILINSPDDAIQEGELADNLVVIQYAEEQSGFLAGYAAVMEGYRNLGFIGGAAVPTVVRYGHGFLQGAQYAAAYLGLGVGAVRVQYYYHGSFAPGPEVTTWASTLFAGGTEVIFTATGGGLFSVISGAEVVDGIVIAVDVDHTALSDVVLTSAKNNYAISVYDMLTDFLNGVFRGGRVLTLDASVNGISLPMETSRFTNFTQAQYDSIFALLADGYIVVNCIVTPSVAEANLDLYLIEVIELNER